ncbi:hypothetical protein Q1695_003539 [Nippostrongylus brasiliensis]|nr:hypothetical protein Q1695_003539 [Nippostrongylus brasiliensis]
MLVLQCLICSAMYDVLEMDSALCNMCHEDEKCLVNLMSKLRIRRCIVGAGIREMDKRDEPAQLRQILLNSYLKRL